MILVLMHILSVINKTRLIKLFLAGEHKRTQPSGSELKKKNVNFSGEKENIRL